MRRIWSLLLAIILIIAFAAPAYAAEPRGSSLGDDIVVWICVSKLGNADVESLNGHAWLIVENNSFVDIAIGDTFISAGDTVTIGGWEDYDATTDTAYVTGTAYVNKETGKNYTDAVALKVSLSPYNLYYLRDAIDAAKDKFYYPDGSDAYPDIGNAYTCVNFALEVWHAIGGATLNVTASPKSATELWSVISGRTHYSYAAFSSLMSSRKTISEI